MMTSIETHASLRRFSFSLLLLILSFGLSLVGCSRSAWVKTNGQEVLPEEQLECAQHVHQTSKEEIVEQEILEKRIEICMLDKGYKHRPWWLLNDLHWHLTGPPR